MIVALLGCPRPPATFEDPAVPLERPVIVEVEPLPVGIGPGPWHGELVSIDVPAGWSGRAGHGAGLVVALQRPDGIALEIWAFRPEDGVEFPRAREGCELLFADRSAYRLVPGLAVTAASSCVPDEPVGVVVDGWYAEIDGRQVHIDALLPSDRVFEGREAVRPILASIRPR